MAKFLFEIDDLNKVEEFYILILNDLLFDHPDRITIQNNLGGIYREKGEYLQALKLHRLIMSSNFVQRATIYNDIGYVYEELGDYSQSLKYH